MSTRATYKIGDVCYYIHYDGYPEGAAKYFKAMRDCENMRGGYAERFIRANDLAQFIEGHDAQGDTEFQYTLNENNRLTAVEARTGHAIFIGQLDEFIEEFAK